MSLRMIAIVLVVVGVVLGAVSLLADSLGIGGSPDMFGTLQIIGLALGAVALVVGIVLYLRAGGNASA
ncbi:MAG: hypothetical protein K8I30_09915 [Anaerolineae bacterium]|nr:hypothetical protein [Anaerolineae bacterium]